MNWKLNLRHPKVQQGIMEVVFPLAGYFFWDWSLLIIVVFYVMDWLASQIMYTRRLIKVKEQFNEILNWVLPLSIIVSLVAIVGVSAFLYSMFQGLYGLVWHTKDLNQELLTFFKAELWYLLPLIIFSYHIMDKMLFYAPRRFVNYLVRPYLYKNIISNSMAVILIFVGAIIYAYTLPSDILAIILIVVVKLFFDVVIKKKVLKID